MDRYRVPFFGVAVALAVSLVVHARAAFDEPAVRPSPNDVGSAAPSTSQPTTAAADAGDRARCCSELEQCRRSSWDIALKAIRGDASNRAKRRAKADDPQQPASARDKDVERRRQALCALSEEFLRQLWMSQRENMTALIHDFGSEAWVDNWVDFKTGELGEALELDDSQQELVEQGYDSLWKVHGPRMQKIIARQPADYDALLRSAQEYFREEDQLLANVLGEEAKASYADSELESRAIIVAILGTFADKPWDQSLGW